MAGEYTDGGRVGVSIPYGLPGAIEAHRAQPDHNSATWRAVAAHVEAQIARLQQQLEQDIDMILTANTRGRINELRLLIVKLGPGASAPLARPNSAPVDYEPRR